MIEFGAIKIAIGKRAVNKGNPNEITSGKITIDKLTGFKFFEMHVFLTISGVLVSAIKEIGCHNMKGFIFYWIIYPTKLRFEKTKNPKTISSKLDYFIDWIIFPAKLRFENTIKIKKRSSELGVFSFHCIYS